MARQQTLKQAFAAVERKKKAPTRIMRQSTLSFNGSASVLRGGSGCDKFDDMCCDCSECLEIVNDGDTCVCSLEKCNFEVDMESCICELCWEKRIDDDPGLEAQRAGFFHEHEESAFTESVWADPPWDSGMMEYYDADRKPKDLKRFVQQRGLLDVFPTGMTLKYYYIKELLAADKDRVFRFLDLPPELRNEVYGYVLAPKSHYSRYTAILRVCKLTHKEATEILYADNVVTCSFWSQQAYNERRVRINRRDYIGTKAVDFIHLPTAIDHYPDYLARIRNLKIDIHIDTLPRSSSTTKNAIVDLQVLVNYEERNRRLRAVRSAGSGFRSDGRWSTQGP